jgi:hypothetical protein
MVSGSGTDFSIGHEFGIYPLALHRGHRIGVAERAVAL